MKKSDKQFKEIAHSGGQFSINVHVSGDGVHSLQFGFRHSRPVPCSLFAVYSLLNSIPVGTIQLGGIGTPWNSPPVEDCIPVFIASDSSSMFGHKCPRCNGYWRSTSVPALWPITCPYCGLKAELHHFLTEGQAKYLKAYCSRAQEALQLDSDGELVIDMDVVADSIGNELAKPDYYYAEESQQNYYTCAACGDKNDILGKYGYCSCCGTHNGFQELTTDIDILRERIKNSEQYEGFVPEAVSIFDSYARQIAKQLAMRIPMLPSRKKDLEKKLFHNLGPCAEYLDRVFGIDLFQGLSLEEQQFAIMMFQRRHIYEHNGGEVDERYIRESGDTSVRVKQVIYETQNSVCKLLSLLVKMGNNLHKGFHSIFPPEEKPIKMYKDRLRRQNRK